MPCPLPHCPGRHTSAVDSDRQFPAVRITETQAVENGAPPIFREVLAALNNRSQRVAERLDADLKGRGSHHSGGNGPGYRSSHPAGRAAAAGGWAGGQRPGDSWRRVLNP